MLIYAVSLCTKNVDRYLCNICWYVFKPGLISSGRDRERQVRSVCLLSTSMADPHTDSLAQALSIRSQSTCEYIQLPYVPISGGVCGVRGGVHGMCGVVGVFVCVCMVVRCAWCVRCGVCEQCGGCVCVCVCVWVHRSLFMCMHVHAHL